MEKENYYKGETYIFDTPEESDAIRYMYILKIRLTAFLNEKFGCIFCTYIYTTRFLFIFPTLSSEIRIHWWWARMCKEEFKWQGWVIAKINCFWRRAWVSVCVAFGMYKITIAFSICSSWFSKRRQRGGAARAQIKSERTKTLRLYFYKWEFSKLANENFLNMPMQKYFSN